MRALNFVASAAFGISLLLPTTGNAQTDNRTIACQSRLDSEMHFCNVIWESDRPRRTECHNHVIKSFGECMVLNDDQMDQLPKF